MCFMYIVYCADNCRLCCVMCDCRDNTVPVLFGIFLCLIYVYIYIHVVQTNTFMYYVLCFIMYIVCLPVSS